MARHPGESKTKAVAGRDRRSRAARLLRIASRPCGESWTSRISPPRCARSTAGSAVVLPDTSIWVGYFRDSRRADADHLASLDSRRSRSSSAARFSLSWSPALAKSSGARYSGLSWRCHGLTSIMRPGSKSASWPRRCVEPARLFPHRPRDSRRRAARGPRSLEPGRRLRARRGGPRRFPALHDGALNVSHWRLGRRVQPVGAQARRAHQLHRAAGPRLGTT